MKTTKVQYRIVPTTRYIVTRYYEGVDSRGDGDSCHASGCETRGEYDNASVAYHVAYALCKADHDKSDEPEGSMNFIYPDIPDGVSIEPM
jgi:hypothetical protein